MNEVRESVFVPCGHRCTCVACATDVYNRFKKCPICNASIETVLKRVYD